MMSGMGRYDGQRTVAAVAITCRDFTEPALDVLWADQSSLDPLIKRIPTCRRMRKVPAVRTMHQSPIAQVILILNAEGPVVIIAELDFV